MSMIISIVLLGCNKPTTSGSFQAKAPNPNSLSASCDYTLCAGYDEAGNQYELVANQSESSRGFEITVGVIKNNAWLYPLSRDFPFLEEDGLFHINVSMAGESGTDLKYPKVNSVIEKLYFIDTGAFLLDCYKANDNLSLYDHYYRIFSCDTLENIRIDCADSTLVYRYCSPSFSSGNVKTYGQIFTDGGKLMMYTETSGTISGWTEDQVFRWDILDTRTLTKNTIVDTVKGIHPCSTLSEGLCFCTDKRFYNTSGQAVIDLSEYTIDMWENGNICFDGGSCTFEAKNNLGTRFQITIDTSGAVLSERAA